MNNLKIYAGDSNLPLSSANKVIEGTTEFNDSGFECITVDDMVKKRFWALRTDPAPNAQ